MINFVFGKFQEILDLIFQNPSNHLIGRGIVWKKCSRKSLNFPRIALFLLLSLLNNWKNNMLFELPVLDEEMFKNLLEQQKNDLLNEIKPLISDIKNDEILTREKVLELLDCSETWLSKMTNNGTIPPIRIGNRVYYSKQGILNIGKEKGKRKKKAIL